MNATNPSGDKPQESPSGQSSAQPSAAAQPQTPPSAASQMDASRALAVKLAQRREVEAAKFLDLIRLGGNLRPILELLKGLDLGKSAELLKAIAAIWSPIPDGANAWQVMTERILMALRIFTEMTPGERDDEWIAFLDKLLGENAELIATIIEIVQALFGSSRAEAAFYGTASFRECTPEVLGAVVNGHQQGKFTTSAIDWANVVRIIQMIFEIIRQFQGSSEVLTVVHPSVAVRTMCADMAA